MNLIRISSLLIRAPIALSLGLAIACAIAWGAAATAEYRKSPIKTSRNLPRAQTFRDAYTWSNPLSEYVISRKRDLPGLASPPWPLWLDWSVGRKGQTDWSIPLHEEAHGFPLRCLCTRSALSAPGVWRYERGLRLAGPPSRGVPAPTDDTITKWYAIDGHSLPLMPIPIGLALDALFWGGVSYLVFRGARWGIVANRRRKGLCVFCKYPRPAGASVCPECGRA